MMDLAKRFIECFNPPAEKKQSKTAESKELESDEKMEVDQLMEDAVVREESGRQGQGQ